MPNNDSFSKEVENLIENLDDSQKDEARRKVLEAISHLSDKPEVSHASNPSGLQGTVDALNAVTTGSVVGGVSGAVIGLVAGSVVFPALGTLVGAATAASVFLVTKSLSRNQ